MLTIEEARDHFENYDAAWLRHLFKGGERPLDEDYFILHGWVVRDGRSFCREQCWPERRYPRFPADQGCSD